MTTHYNDDQNMTNNCHDAACKAKYGNFDVFNEITSDLFLNDDDDNDQFEQKQEDNMDDEDDVVLLAKDAKQSQSIHLLKPVDEHLLSQKMSQLSTSHKKSVISTIIDNDDDDDIEKIPGYLSKRNKPFKEMIYQTSLSLSLKNKMKELRQITILMHKIMLIEMSHSLWTTYLKSGMGTLKSNQSHIVKVWPTEVKLLVVNQGTYEDDDKGCLIYVNNYLCKLDEKLKKYQIELNTKKTNLNIDTRMIEIFVKQGLESRRMEIEHNIKLIRYDYNDHVLDFEYLQQNPSKRQKQIARRICHAKYEEEITKEEFNLLQQQISNQTSSETCKSHVILFDSIKNSNVKQQQQQLHEQYRKIAQQSRDEMLTVYLTSAEAQMRQCQKQFNDEAKKMWQEQRTFPINQKLSNIMLDLIEQRCNNISERVKFVYNFKAHLFRLNPVV